MSTSVTSAPGIRPHKYATREPTTPAPTTAIAVGRARRRVPDRIERGLHIGGQHRTLRR